MLTSIKKTVGYISFITRRSFSEEKRRVIPTLSPYVWLPDDMPNYTVNLDVMRSKRSEYFNGTAKYLSPKDFNYEPPSEGVPEFAFVGRSNVGKSSLIGKLIDNPDLVCPFGICLCVLTTVSYLYWLGKDI